MEYNGYYSLIDYSSEINTDGPVNYTEPCSNMFVFMLSRSSNVVELVITTE